MEAIKALRELFSVTDKMSDTDMVLAIYKEYAHIQSELTKMLVNAKIQEVTKKLNEVHPVSPKEVVPDGQS